MRGDCGEARRAGIPFKRLRLYGVRKQNRDCGLAVQGKSGRVKQDKEDAMDVRKIAREIVEGSVVLLKNEEELLP
ncbi:hypothetical protein, partial [Neglectibacter timonensis]|uniref:hypothetical protein n=1 Tax=Neglectibacter timonensis TaxID=1776382 RepID=UPI003219E239